MSTEEAFVPATSEWYYPPEEIVNNAVAPDYDTIYKEALADPEKFWADRAETLDCISVGTRCATRWCTSLWHSLSCRHASWPGTSPIRRATMRRWGM